MDANQMLILLEESIRAADPDKRAPLVAQWRALRADMAVAAVPSSSGGDPVDDIAKRRAARAAAGAGGAGAG